MINVIAYGETMRMNDIQVGHTYAEKRFGKVERTVIGIGREFNPGYKAQDGRGVKYRQVANGRFSDDRPGVLYRERGFNFDQRMKLDHFADWCGKDVTPNVISASD